MYKDRLEGYKVTEDGKVLTFKAYQNGAELKQCLNGRGYYHVALNGRTVAVHRLVAWLYCNGYEKGLQVNHIDGNKLNNNKDNLEWIDAQENCVHAMKYIPTSRRLYSNDMIRDIRVKYELWKNNKDRRYTSPKLALEYGVSKVTICNIINGDRYSYI